MAELKNLPNQRPTGVMVTPTSPKIKSAPATPCSVTPTAFHQHNLPIQSQQNQNQASTLPKLMRHEYANPPKDIASHLHTLKIRGVQEDKEVSETPEVTPTATQKVDDDSLLDDLMRNGDISLEQEKWEDAIKAYSNCIELAESTKNEQYLKKNFKVYTQRAEAYFKFGNYNEAAKDSIRARDINPKWIRAYYLQGKSLFLSNQHDRSLAVFSYGLAQDPTNKELFKALVNSALKSEFQDKFEPKYNQLRSMKLDKEPFVVVAILGQELLLLKHQHAVVILESALKIGTEDKRLKSSVLSTVSYAYCIMEDYEKAVSSMQKELELENELEDVNGQCRVLTNLGYTYYKMRKFDESLEAHREQVKLAMRNKIFPKVYMSLNAIGHVHMAKNDLDGALTSHMRCLEILRLLGDNNFNQFKELLSIGHIHTILGDYKVAEERYMEGSRLLNGHNQEECRMGRIMMNFNLAYLALRRQGFNQAKKYYSEVMELAQLLPDQQQALIKTRATTGINQTINLIKKSSLNYSNELELVQTLTP